MIRRRNDVFQKGELNEPTTLSLDAEVTDGYIGDLLSDVMGNAPANSIWLTVQSHTNILAVASIVGVKAIVLCNDLHFEEVTKKKAEENNIVLMESKETSFDVATRLIKSGLKG
jgi:hypothetical protein